MATLEFYDKDKNKINVNGNLNFLIERIKRKAVGGNEQLFFDVEGDDLSLDAFLYTMLGKYVRVYDDSLQDEGFFEVETMDRFKDGVNYRKSIKELYNRFAVQYVVIVDNEEQTFITDYITDETSIETFGERTKIINIGESTQLYAETRRDLLFEDYRLPQQTTTVAPANTQSKISVIAVGLYSRLEKIFFKKDYADTELGYFDIELWDNYAGQNSGWSTFNPLYDQPVFELANSNDINSNKTYIKLKNDETYKIAKKITIPLVFPGTGTFGTVIEHDSSGNTFKVFRQIFFNRDIVINIRKDKNGVPDEIIKTLRMDRVYPGTSVPYYTQDSLTHPTTIGGGETITIYRPPEAEYPHNEPSLTGFNFNHNIPDLPYGYFHVSRVYEIPFDLENLWLEKNETYWIEVEPAEMEWYQRWQYPYTQPWDGFNYSMTYYKRPRIMMPYTPLFLEKRTVDYDRTEYGEPYTVKDGVFTKIENPAANIYYAPQFKIEYEYDLESLIKTVLEQSNLFDNVFVDQNVVNGNIEVTQLLLNNKSVLDALSELFDLGTTEKENIVIFVTPDSDIVVTIQDKQNAGSNFYLRIDKNNKLYNADGSEYKRTCPVGYWGKIDIIDQMNENLASGENKFFYVSSSEFDFKSNEYTYSSESIQNQSTDSARVISGTGGSTADPQYLTKAVYDSNNDGKVNAAVVADSANGLLGKQIDSSTLAHNKFVKFDAATQKFVGGDAVGGGTDFDILDGGTW
ncbi:MAG: hypothetical protein KGZ97_09665 [Bacteroidetes bacterium]|nr:hypothetical protein [Bacteroidota bacterium]